MVDKQGDDYGMQLGDDINNGLEGCVFVLFNGLVKNYIIIAKHLYVTTSTKPPWRHPQPWNPVPLI